MLGNPQGDLDGLIKLFLSRPTTSSFIIIFSRSARLYGCLYMGLLPSVKILNLLIEQHSKSSKEVANLSSNSASNSKNSTSSDSGKDPLV